jgi:hypothetical protein
MLMKPLQLMILVYAIVAVCGCETPVASSPKKGLTEMRTVSIFDGKTFDGWEGNLDYFRIQDGAIVAGSLKQGIPRNEFLCTKKVYRDFELSLKVKLIGDSAKANAGIQIRSRRIPNHHEMIGYQADMGQHYWGCLYDESRRNRILAKPDPDESIEQASVIGLQIHGGPPTEAWVQRTGQFMKGDSL